MRTWSSLNTYHAVALLWDSSRQRQTRHTSRNNLKVQHLVTRLIAKTSTSTWQLRQGMPQLYKQIENNTNLYNGSTNHGVRTTSLVQRLYRRVWRSNADIMLFGVSPLCSAHPLGSVLWPTRQRTKLPDSTRTFCRSA